MTELTTQIVARTAEALDALHQAEVEEDLHLAAVRTGELESLARVAQSHGLDIPDLRPYSPLVA